MTCLSQCTKERATDELRFGCDGWNLIATLNSQLSTLNSFAWGLDLSGSFQGAGGIGGLLWVNNGSASTHFVSYDGNGNVTALVSAADGSESARYEYGPFGEVIRATGPMTRANPFRFSTKYQDDETDLLYYGYRYYNASTGRWLSKDPIEEEGGINLYAFVENDPISEADLFGLSPFTPTSACRRTALRASLTIPGWMTPALSTISKVDRWDFKFHGDYTECSVCCPKGGFGKTATINAGLVLEMKFSGRKIPLGIATFEYGLFGRISGSGGLYGGYSTCDKSAFGGGCVAVTGEIGLIASVEGGRLSGLEVGAGARGGFRLGYQMCLFCTADGCALRHRVCGALRGRYWGNVKVGKRKWELHQEYSINSCTPWGYIAGGPQPGEPDVAPPITID